MNVEDIIGICMSFGYYVGCSNSHLLKSEDYC